MAVSNYDKEHLSAEEQAFIADLTQQAQSGAISWDQAHNQAETIRMGAGYSGGTDGSGYNPTYGGSIYDNQYMTEDELASIADVRASAVMGETDWDSAHSYAEGIRANYGYSGDSDGSKYIPLATGEKFTYESAPTYTSKYSAQIDELTQALLNRDPFSYDYTQDPLYHQYAETYTREGDRAMQDTIGQVAARTGGLASSYATTAGAQANNYYMAQLSDKIPELQQLAYSMYMDEYDEQYQNIQLLMALEEGDYNKYLTLLDQYNTDRNFDYGVFSDDRAYNYQVGRDAIEDSRYDTEWNYQVGRDAKNDAQERIDNYLAAGGKASELDSTLVAESGYTQAELAAIEMYYSQQAQAAKQTSSGGGGGGGGGDTPTGDGIDARIGTNAWYQQLYDTYGDEADVMLTYYYKELGIGNQSAAQEAREGYANWLESNGGSPDDEPDDEGDGIMVGGKPLDEYEAAASNYQEVRSMCQQLIQNGQTDDALQLLRDCYADGVLNVMDYSSLYNAVRDGRL